MVDVIPLIQFISFVTLFNEFGQGLQQMRKKTHKLNTI